MGMLEKDTSSLCLSQTRQRVRCDFGTGTNPKRQSGLQCKQVEAVTSDHQWRYHYQLRHAAAKFRISQGF